nr:leucine aminopeptidase 1-like [Tanacetum cinerariifolium]
MNVFNMVNNTDAEGRLTLADALVYACNLGVDKIVDLATLTGACIVALGPKIAGIFTPNDELAKEVVAASEVAGEQLWRMPLEESYWEFMKSGVADMANSGGRQGGSILAALFLKQFVDEKVQWLHIDMAGPVWNDNKKTATGFAVPTLVEWVSYGSWSLGLPSCEEVSEVRMVLVELSKEMVHKIASTNLSEVEDNGLKEMNTLG